jgi:hypothetical protein
MGQPGMGTEDVRTSLGFTQIIPSQTPTKLQPPPPRPLPGSIISCYPLLKPCWPQPPTGPSLTRAFTLEPQALLEFHGADPHHTPSPASVVMGIREA